MINVDKGYVCHREDFDFVDGIFDLCRTFQQRGFLMVVVTNQAGIGRGYYTERDFLELTDWMRSAFREEGIHVAQVYYCPFHPEHGIGPFRRDSFDRKPNPGMLLRARDELGIDLSQSVLIGDRWTDILAGERAGVATRFWLLRPDESATEQVGAFHACRSLREPAAWLESLLPGQVAPR